MEQACRREVTVNSAKLLRTALIQQRLSLQLHLRSMIQGVHCEGGPHSFCLATSKESPHRPADCLTQAVQLCMSRCSLTQKVVPVPIHICQGGVHSNQAPLPLRRKDRQLLHRIQGGEPARQPAVRLMFATVLGT